jgi:hypothetical protein
MEVRLWISMKEGQMMLHNLGTKVGGENLTMFNFVATEPSLPCMLP